MGKPSMPFLIAGACGLLDAGARAVTVAGAAAGAGWLTALIWAPSPWIRLLLTAVSTINAVGALWLMVRIAIDRKLFAALDRAEHVADTQGAGTLSALDGALIELCWIDESKAGRTLEARVQGVAALCRKAVLLAAVQIVLVGAMLAASAFVSLR